jgi:hypothetical protein
MNYNFDKLFEKKNEIGCGTLLVVVIFLIALAVGISCLYAWIGMLLWNWVMPMIWAGAPVMTFWPMWGLIELCSILFKTHNYNSNNNNN